MSPYHGNLRNNSKFLNFLTRGFLWTAYKKGCSCSNLLVVNCLILAFIDFLKNGNSDNNLALVNFLILGFIVLP